MIQPQTEIVDNPSLIKPALQELKKNYLKGATRPLQLRKKALQGMLDGINKLSKQFHQALKEDLGVDQFGSQLLSLFITKKEIENNLNNLGEWAKPVPFDTPVAIGPGKSYAIKQPLGVVLVMSAWNYPIYTSIGAVAPAIAAGNCVILKPSQMAPASSKVLSKLFQKYMDPNFYKIIEGKIQVAKAIVTYPFDLIIFTGSPQKGKLVAKAAAQNLTPCILELGGKSPAIVDEDANLQVSAQRIVQGRFTNSGQTCVAPDYVLAHKSIKSQLIKLLVKQTKAFYPDRKDLAQIINSDHVNRLKGYLQEDHHGQIVVGGQIDQGNRFIVPTIVDNPSLDCSLMKEEIFGPILPVREFETIQEVSGFVNEREKPLAMYYFGNKNKDYLLEHTSSGAFMSNDTIFHVTHTELPFGGVGNSGMGAYHGKFGFDGCSHLKPVIEKGTLNVYPLSARYPPYHDSKKSLLLFMMKNTFIGQHKLLFRLGLAGLVILGAWAYWSGVWKKGLNLFSNQGFL